jgi:hypothetical protein
VQRRSLRKAELEDRFIRLLRDLSLKPALTGLLRVAIEAKLASQRSMGAKQIAQLRERPAALGTRQRQILDKSLSGVFYDSNTKELLSEAEQESDNLHRQIAAAKGSEMVPVQVIKTGLAVLQDRGPSGRSPA